MKAYEIKDHIVNHLVSVEELDFTPRFKGNSIFIHLNTENTNMPDRAYNFSCPERIDLEDLKIFLSPKIKNKIKKIKLNYIIKTSCLTLRGAFDFFMFKGPFSAGLHYGSYFFFEGESDVICNILGFEDLRILKVNNS